MKTPALLLCLLMLTPAFAQDDKTPAPKNTKPPVVKRVASLDDCPEAVRNAVKKNGHDKALTEINVMDDNGVKTWTFETGSEDKGKDEEINYFYSEKGELLRTEKDIALKAAPEAVQAALQKLAGTTTVVDDVEEVTAGTTITYKAELESNGGADRKVRLSATGEVLELIEETDD
jgi:hypothetical protein